MEISPNDYSIIISNFPTDYEAKNDDYDDDFKEFFGIYLLHVLEKNALEKELVDVVRIVMCFDLHEQHHMIMDLNKVI